MVVEARLLAERSTERYAATDLALYLSTPAGSFAYLLVQVDGAQHFEQEHCFAGQTVEEQQARDAAYNAAALSQRFSVTRLHHADAEEYDAALQAALQLLLQGSQSFLFFSRSYGFPLTARLPGTVMYHA